MKVSNFKEIIKKTKHLTKYYYLHVMGEPLLHPDFEEILKTGKTENVFLHITTNGTLIEKQLESILKYKPRKISISLHSLEENAIFSKEFTQNTLRIANILSENDILTELRLWNNDYSKKNNYILTLISSTFNVNACESIKIKPYLYLNIGESFEWPSITKDVISENGFCLGLSQQIAFLCDGTVVPCCLDSEAYHNFGNILTEDIDDILKKCEVTEMLSAFKNRKFKSNLCKRCGYAKSTFG